MKKLITLLVLSMILSACSSATTASDIDEEKYDAYLTYYQSILDYGSKQESSDYYDINVVASLVDDDTYRYDVIIDNPQVAMYNIIVLVIVDNVSSTINYDEMMPSVGIFEDEEYNMLPGQVDADKNFVEGLDLSVTSSESSIHLSAVVIFENGDGSKTTREYLSLSASYQEAEVEEGTETTEVDEEVTEE